MHRGFFISIEGGEGAGKSTAIQWITVYLQSKGLDVITTREPGGIPISEQIRSIILDTRHTTMDGRTEALLYAAARRQHLVERIIPALSQHKIVICDRFIDSSLAYQGHARGLGIEEVLKINEFAIHRHMPDLTIYMDVEPAIGLARIHADRDREINRLDLEKMEFHQKVQEGYNMLLQRFPERIVRMDANVNEQAVIRQLQELVDDRLSDRYA